MAPQLERLLVEHLKDAHAMETSVTQMLDIMIRTTQDPEMRTMLAHHKEETQQHRQRLEECLQAHGQDSSTVKDMAGRAGALMMGLIDITRSEKAAKNARDGFVVEHLEIASYELLERIANRAGDERTADVARRNRADEQAMAQRIAANWDKVVDATVAQANVAAAA